MSLMTADEPRAVSIIVAGDVYEVGAAFIKAAVDECGYLVFDLRDIDVGFAQTGPCANRAPSTLSSRSFDCRV